MVIKLCLTSTGIKVKRQLLLLWTVQNYNSVCTNYSRCTREYSQKAVVSVIWQKGCELLEVVNLLTWDSLVVWNIHMYYFIFITLYVFFQKQKKVWPVLKYWFLKGNMPTYIKDELNALYRLIIIIYHFELFEPIPLDDVSGNFTVAFKFNLQFFSIIHKSIIPFDKLSAIYLRKA